MNKSGKLIEWKMRWGHQDSNPRPHPYNALKSQKENGGQGDSISGVLAEK